MLPPKRLVDVCNSTLPCYRVSNPLVSTRQPVQLFLHFRFRQPPRFLSGGQVEVIQRLSVFGVASWLDCDANAVAWLNVMATRPMVRIS